MNRQKNSQSPQQGKDIEVIDLESPKETKPIIISM